MSRRPNSEDPLPEHVNYRDTGCSVSPSCLNCPLLRCRYDEPGAVEELRRAARDAPVVELARRGLRPPEIAAATGLSVRTVYRVLRRNGL